MCGITGIIKKNITKNDEFSIAQMNSLLHSRGPDNSNVFVGKDFIFGHTRLSILDLSIHGNQPLASKNNNFTISYNGEIYNNYDLKKKLIEINRFNCIGHSDTEIFLNYIEVFGLYKALEDAVGMYAFSLYDKIKNKFYLVRDKLGEKPLYYTIQNNELIFASQIKAIASIDKIPKVLNYKVLSAFFNYNYIQAPDTIYKNIFQLEPGCFLEFDINNFTKKIIKFFEINKSVKYKKNKNLHFKNVLTETDEIISKIISEQSISDVNLGSFLSGGIDSSLVTAYLQKNSSKKIKTYNVSYKNHNYDESNYANQIAKILGTDHHTLEINDEMIYDQVFKLADIYDEPFADSSQIPTSLVCSIASKNLRVCLSGDGGDEIFAGYNRHIFVKKYFSYFEKINLKYRKQIKYLFNKIPLNKIEIIDKIKNNKFVNISNKFFKIINIADFKNLEDFYKQITVNNFNYDVLNNDLSNYNFKFRNEDIFTNPIISNLQKSLLIDQSNYLCDDIFTKVDRSSMHYSLEVRCPLADVRLINHMNQMNDEFKINKNSKLILRKLLENFIPLKLIDRPKMGFGIPISNILKGKLKNLIYDKLSQKNLEKCGIFNQENINSIIYQHMDGKKDNSQILWTILVFILWYEKNF